jgi:hypothetical protein
MTITGPDARSAAPGQAVVDAAMLVLERMGLTPADLLAATAARPPAADCISACSTMRARPTGFPGSPDWRWRRAEHRPRPG